MVCSTRNELLFVSLASLTQLNIWVKGQSECEEMSNNDQHLSDLISVFLVIKYLDMNYTCWIFNPSMYLSPVGSCSGECELRLVLTSAKHIRKTKLPQDGVCYSHNTHFLFIAILKN